MKLKKCGRGGRPLVDRLESRSYLSGASFSGPTFIQGVDNITGMATGDLTGNGQDDIVVAGQLSGTTNSVVAIFHSNGGTFSNPKTIIPLNGTTGGVAIGDFLGNGHQDIAVVDTGDNTLNVLLNDGSGNFSQGVGAALGGGGGDTSVTLGDFDHDGKQDVAVVDPTNNTVNTFISAGDQFGTFVGGSTISVPSPGKVLAADLNGDGMADLAILSTASPNSIYVALNNGNDTFATPVHYPIGVNSQSINDIAVANLNGGALPVIIGLGIQTGNSSGVASVLPNDGHGAFGSPVTFTVAAGAMLAAIGSFSGSGNQDIASISNAGALAVLSGDGAGGFGPDQAVFTTQLGTPGTQAVVGDFDGDGRPDIAFSSSSGGFGVLLGTAGAGRIVPTVTGSLTGAASSETIATTPLKIKEKLTLTASNGATRGKASAIVQLSPDENAADSVYMLSTAKAVLNLRAGKQASINLRIPRTIPSTVAAGTYHVLLTTTDTAGNVVTTDSGQSVTVVEPVIDLTASMVAPMSARAGRRTRITFLVTNTSTANVSAIGFLPFDVDTSPDGLLSDATMLLPAGKRFINLKPGRSVSIAVLATISASTFLVVQLDPADAIFPNDIDLTNNTFSQQIIAT